MLLAPKGQLLTAQLSPLTLIKVFLGSWFWWTWKTLKVESFFFFNLLFSPGGMFPKTPKLMNFPVHFTRYFCLHVWLKMEAFHKSQSRNHFISQFVDCIQENMGLFLRNLLPKNLWQQYKLTSVPFCRGGVDFSSYMTDDVTKCDRECSCWSRNKEVQKTRDRTQKYI